MVITESYQGLRGKWLKVLKGNPTKEQLTLFKQEMEAFINTRSVQGSIRK